jgi:hypothetical protein
MIGRRLRTKRKHVAGTAAATMGEAERDAARVPTEFVVWCSDDAEGLAPALRGALPDALIAKRVDDADVAVVSASHWSTDRVRELTGRTRGDVLVVAGTHRTDATDYLNAGAAGFVDGSDIATIVAFVRALARRRMIAHSAPHPKTSATAEREARGGTGGLGPVD